MAAHHITIAKASFAASLLRPDVVKVSRDDLPKFHSAFDAALVCCSRHNIQACKDWLLENVLVSATRTSAFAKYLTTVSRHLALPPAETVQTSLARQRLHILYLVNDLLHHSKYHSSEAGYSSRVISSLQPFLLDLVRSASLERTRKVSKRLEDLLAIWEQEQYFGGDVVNKLREVVAGVEPLATIAPQEPAQSDDAAKGAPYVLPATHGDPSLPFYDLPAGNLLPHIVPNSSQPIRPDDVQALRFSRGPADKSLVNALKDFLDDIQAIDDTISHVHKEGSNPEMDEMGQITYHDEAGDLVGDTYYGWSRAFCEKMRRRGRSDTDGSSRRTRSLSSSRSPSRGRIPYKRRRYSNSTTDHSRPSRSYSRSPSGPRNRALERGRSVSRKRNRSLSSSRPDPPDSKEPQPKNIAVSTPMPANNPPAIPLALPGIGFPLPPPPPFHPGSLPFPPPRPMNWTGPWPPVPPPPPSYPHSNSAFQNLPLPPPPSHLPPPPPPPAGWPLPPGAPYGRNYGYQGQ